VSMANTARTLITRIGAQCSHSLSLSSKGPLQGSAIPCPVAAPVRYNAALFGAVSPVSRAKVQVTLETDGSTVGTKVL
jgi:hypothetical protein